jgi:hypothetical protein
MITTIAQREADRRRGRRDIPPGCPFCGAGSDEHYVDCMIRGLTPGDAARLAPGFDAHADELRAKGAMLWAIAGVDRINSGTTRRCP